MPKPRWIAYEDVEFNDFWNAYKNGTQHKGYRLELGFRAYKIVKKNKPKKFEVGGHYMHDRFPDQIMKVVEIREDKGKYTDLFVHWLNEDMSLNNSSPLRIYYQQHRYWSLYDQR